jgi:hypothetical protein
MYVSQVCYSAACAARVKKEKTGIAARLPRRRIPPPAGLPRPRHSFSQARTGAQRQNTDLYQGVFVTSHVISRLFKTQTKAVI